MSTPRAPFSHFVCFFSEHSDLKKRRKISAHNKIMGCLDDSVVTVFMCCKTQFYQKLCSTVGSLKGTALSRAVSHFFWTFFLFSLADWNSSVLKKYSPNSGRSCSTSFRRFAWHLCVPIPQPASGEPGSLLGWRSFFNFAKLNKWKNQFFRRFI